MNRQTFVYVCGRSEIKCLFQSDFVEDQAAQAGDQMKVLLGRRGGLCFHRRLSTKGVDILVNPQ